MEVNLMRDLPANLPLPITNAIPSGFAAKAETQMKNTSADKTGFSDKLTKAMDNTTSIEAKTPVKQKNSPKAEPVKTDEETEADGETDSKATAETPNMGLAWLQTAIVTPVTQEETLPAAGANTELPVQTSELTMPGQNQTWTAGMAIESENLKDKTLQQELLAAEGRQSGKENNPVVASQSQATVLSTKPDSLPAMQDNASVTTQETVMAVSTQSETIQPAGAAVVVPNDKIATEAKSNTASFAQTPTVVMADANATEMVSFEQSAQAKEATLTPATVIDPEVQTAVATVNVSTTAQQPVKPEAATAPEVQEPLDQTTEGTVEIRAAVSTEKQSQQGSLGESKQDSTPLYDEKSTAASALSAATFDRPTNFTDHVAAATAQAPEPRTDLYEVARQVMDSLQASTEPLQTSQVIITLKPEHLGEVTVKINVDGDKVTASFHAASAEVRSILESSLPQFKQEMSQQGWNFDSDGIYSAMQEFMGKGQEQQFQQFQQQSIPTPIRQRPEVYDDVVAFGGNGKIQVMSASAVDYRV